MDNEKTWGPATSQPSLTMNEWDEVDQQDQSLTLEQMDALVQELKQFKDDADYMQKRADEAKAAYGDKRDFVLASLKANNRSNYAVDGVATVYITSKEVYRIPSTNADKTKLFNYIKETYGPDALMSMVNIHSATLTSWANSESEKGVMSIPGLEAPTMMETLSVRKK